MTTVTAHSIDKIAKQLVEKCRNQDYAGAHKELYASEACSVEMNTQNGKPDETKGLDAIKKKVSDWEAENETISCELSNPLVADNCFAVLCNKEVNNKQQGRIKMKEIGIYEVKDGKIVKESFYHRHDA